MQYGDPISVIIPCYNRAHSIERAVQSVFAQSYRNIELIVVDDCSTDGSVALVKAIADPRLRVVQRKTNGGAGAARNSGVEAASHDLIAFQDSDDAWFPEKLETQMHHFTALSDDHVAVFCSKIIYGRSMDESGRRRYGPRRASCVPAPWQRIPEDGDLSEAFLWGNFMGPPTVLLKKAAFLAAGGYDPRLRSNDDWDLHLRLSRQGRIGFLDTPLMVVYDSPDGISKHPEAKAFSTIVIFGKLKKHQPTAPALAPTALTIHRQLMLRGKVKSSRRFLRKAIQLRPLKLALWLRLALSYAPDFYGNLLRARVTTRRRRTT